MNSITLTNTNAGTEERHRLSYKLPAPMKIDKTILCLSDLTMFYSWYNIKAKYENNVFYYQEGTKTPHKIVLLLWS